MKIIPLTTSACAFEPDAVTDQLGLVTADQLKALGVNDVAVEMFLNYRAASVSVAAATGETDDLLIG
jgi:hypothetical protein